MKKNRTRTAARLHGMDLALADIPVDRWLRIYDRRMANYSHGIRAEFDAAFEATLQKLAGNKCTK